MSRPHSRPDRAAARIIQLLRSSMASAVLGATAIVAAICFSVIRSRHDSLLFANVPNSTHHQYGAGKDLVMEPVDWLAVTDERIQLWILVTGAICAILAMTIGVRRVTSGAKDHFSVFGLVFGAIGLSWTVLLAGRMLF